MIVLFTDFGWQGPYVGQMKAVLHRHAPNLPIVDLMHDVPAFNSRAGAHLLAAAIEPFTAGTVFLCVVDPGVGDPARVPVALWADGRWFVGPANGLLDVIAKRSAQAQWYRIAWTPSHLSDSFHGRDVFAVVAADLALARTDKLEPWDVAPPPGAEVPDPLNEFIYIDAYGNAMTALPGGVVNTTRTIALAAQRIGYARTFSGVGVGEPFWYVNALGLVEIAINQGNAAWQFGISIGDPVVVDE